MVKLTEEMVAARSRISDCTSVKKLNCWGTELTDVSILRKMRNVEVLSLSVNNINSLADFQHCIFLKDLFVRKNNIQDLNEVCYLQGLPHLKNLWLGENPCAGIDGYRLAVIKALPGLEKLDDKMVTPEEVQSAILRGKTLVHPITMVSKISALPASSSYSPELQEYVEELETNLRQNYSSSDDQQGCEEATTIGNRQHADKENTNYNRLAEQQVDNQYQFEESSERPLSGQNENYDETCSRDYSSAPNSPYNRIERHESQMPPVEKKVMLNENIEKETNDESPNWMKHNEKEKLRSQFQYQRRPVTRSSNILSAVLCLVKELDYPSLEVVEMAVRTRIDELEE